MATLSNYYRLIETRVIDPTLRPEYVSTFAVTADLNADGKQDLIVLGASYPGGSDTPQPGGVYFGDGKGGFTPANALFPVNTLQTVHPRKVLTQDFNSDGRPDVFISSHGWDAGTFPGEQNRLYLSQPDGTWIDATGSLPQLYDYSHTSAVGDINGDGSLDIFVGNGYHGQNGIFAYNLINNGNGNFSQSTFGLPLARGEILDFDTGHMFPGATLVDLDGDNLPELIITADASSPSFSANLRTTVLWNDNGTFTQANATQLPATQSLAAHIDLDAEGIDINPDGLKDLVLIGTQGNPFYDGAFIQVFLNKGNHQFQEVTSQVMPVADIAKGAFAAATGTAWPTWITVLDFNRDGFSDFAVEYTGQLTQATPLVWLNDGTGHFTTLHVSDFVNPGNEWRLGTGHLTQTDNGYSFFTTQSYNGSKGLVLTGLLATSPYLNIPAATQGSLNINPNDVLETTRFDDTFDGGAGLDRVIYHGPSTDYFVTKNASGFRVLDRTTADGTDQLSNIERVVFTDVTVALDIEGNGGQAYRLYKAAFDRTPDKSGLGFWITQLDNGATLDQVASGFVNSLEFQAINGAAPTNLQLVTSLYQHILGRAPDHAGLDFWTTQMNNNALDKSHLLTSFSESNENKIALIGQIENGIEYIA